MEIRRVVAGADRDGRSHIVSDELAPAAHSFTSLPGAEADEVRVVSQGDATDRLVALFRRADRIVGALTVNGQNVIMKYRALIARRSDWAGAMAYAQRAQALA